MATIDNLVIEIEGNATQASGSIDKLKASLEGLRTATSNFRSLNVVAKSIENIKNSLVGFDGTAAQSLNLMTDALSKLEGLGGVKLSTSIASQLKSIADVTRDLGGVDWSQIKVMADSLVPIAGIQKSNGLNNTVNALRKMPEAIQGINSLNPEIIAEFTERVEQLRVAIHPLADEMRAVSAGFSALPANIQKAIKANQKLTSSTEKTTRSFGSLLSRVVSVGAAYYGFRKLFSFAMDAFEASNNFIESLNLAQVAMGEGSKAAVEYAEKVERLAGIDMSKWITQVGTFNQQLEGFGIPADKANQMAQMLTQLGYDIQSAFNVSDLSTVMDRLSSGISGQIKGMRSYGVELSVAAMQEFALSHGITEQWKNMSQAQKVALRYAKIMEQTTNIQGDLARTIITPANSLRILQSQFGIAARYIGQIVSVIAAKVIPVFSAIAQVIGMAAKAIAAFFGFTLPDISTSVGKDFDIAVGGAEDLEDAIGGAGGAAKDAKNEIKGLLAGWDEINIIQQQNDTAGSGGGGGGGGSIGDIGDLIDIGQYGYDFLKGIQNNVDELVAKIKGIMPEVLSFLAAIAAYGIGSKIADICERLGLAENKVSAIKDIVAGISLAIIGTTLSWEGIHDIDQNGFSVGNVLETMAGSVANALGFMKIGKGIAKWVGNEKFNAFQFGVGAAIIINGLALTDVAVDNIKSEGISTKAILEAISGALAYAIGGKMVADAFGLPVGVGIGAGITVWAVQLSKVVADSIATEGINAHTLLLAVGDAVAAAFGVAGATAALGASLPLAISLGAIAGVTLAIATVEIGLNQNAEQVAKAAFASSGDGGFTPEEVIEALQAEFTERTKGAKLVIEAYSDVETIAKSLDTAKTNIQALNQAVIGEGAATPEQINALKEAWGGFDATLENLNNANYETVFAGLNQMLNSELAEVQGKAKEFQKQYLIIHQGMTERQAERATERNEILDRMLAGTATDADMERYARLSAFDMDMSISEGMRNWETFKNEGFTVDFSNMDDSIEGAKQYVNDAISSYGDAVSTLDTAYKDFKSAIENDRYELEQEYKHGYITESQYISSANWLDQMLSTYKQDIESQKGSLSQDLFEIYNNLFDQIFDNPALETMTDRQLDKYMTKVAEPIMDAIGGDEFFSGLEASNEPGNVFESFMDMLFNEDQLSTFEGNAKAFDSYIDNVVFPLLNKLDEAGALTKEQSDLANDIAGMLISPMFGGTDFDPNGLYYNNMFQLGGEPIPLSDYILDWVSSGERPELQMPAIDTETDFAPSQTEFSSDVSTWIADEVNPELTPVMQKIDTQQYFDQSKDDIYNGVIEWRGEVEPETMLTAYSPNMDNIYNGMNGVLMYAQRWYSAMQSYLNLGGSSRGWSVPSNIPGKPTYASLAPNVPTLTIPAYAGGGFPTEGQLFIANEQGPELVGQMGSAPAVANGDQIITGITEGVSRGQEEQNRLLREQNELLRGLLSKETSVVLRPSAEFGRMNQRSYEMYKKVGG